MSEGREWDKLKMQSWRKKKTTFFFNSRITSRNHGRYFVNWYFRGSILLNILRLH